MLLCVVVFLVRCLGVIKFCVILVVCGVVRLFRLKLCSMGFVGVMFISLGFIVL